MPVTIRKVCKAIAVVAVTIVVTGLSAQSGPLRVGAAKVDVTPDANALPLAYTTIRDHIYVLRLSSTTAMRVRH